MIIPPDSSHTSRWERLFESGRGTWRRLKFRRSPEEERINIKIRPAMLGNANIEPACSRLYPRPTSKYDGSQVSTPCDDGVYRHHSIVQLDERPRSEDAYPRHRRLVGLGCTGSASSRRFPLRI